MSVCGIWQVFLKSQNNYSYLSYLYINSNQKFISPLIGTFIYALLFRKSSKLWFVIYLSCLSHLMLLHYINKKLTKILPDEHSKLFSCLKMYFQEEINIGLKHCNVLYPHFLYIVINRFRPSVFLSCYFFSLCLFCWRLIISKNMILGIMLMHY